MNEQPHPQAPPVHKAAHRHRALQRKRRRVLTAAALVFLLMTAVVTTSLAVWSLRATRRLGATEQQLTTERDQALEAAAEAKSAREQAEAARVEAIRGRDQALTVEKGAQSTTEDAKAVLAFLQDRLLSVGRPPLWADGQWARERGKDATLRQAVDAVAQEVGKAFPDRPLAEASVREMLGSAYVDFGEPALAIRQYEPALAIRETLLGVDNADTVVCRTNLARAYRLAGRTVEASSLYDAHPSSSFLATALAVRGSVLLRLKKASEAESKLRECLALRQQLQPDDWTIFETKSLLGEALLDQQHYAAAEPLLLTGYQGLKANQAKIPRQDRPAITRALERVVQLYETWNKTDEAARWRKELEAIKTATK